LKIKAVYAGGKMIAYSHVLPFQAGIRQSSRMPKAVGLISWLREAVASLGDEMESVSDC